MSIVKVKDEGIVFVQQMVAVHIMTMTNCSAV
jgi:hypothetical protein